MRTTIFKTYFPLRGVAPVVTFFLAFLVSTTVYAQSPPTGLISINRLGTGSSNQGASSNGLSVSANGRYVAFVSDATDLALNDTNFASDVFVRDRLTGQTILVSVNAAGTGPADQVSRLPTITPDGRFVVFISAASDLVTDDAATSIHEDVYIRDLQLGTTKLVSRNSTGNARGNSASGWFDPLGVSDNGRFVVFTSSATDLTATPDNNSQTDVFVRDMQTNTTKLVSINQSGTATGNNVSDSAVITPDGRFVAFLSQARDLITLDTGFRRQVFVRDLQAGTTKLVTPNRFGSSGGNGDVDPSREHDLSISADGRYIAYVTDANDMVANDTNSGLDIFVRDTQSQTTSLVSVDKNGAPPATGNSGQIAMTPDGRYITFVSGSDNLVNNDSNKQQDVFVRDLQTNTTTLISVNQTGTAGGNGSPDSHFISFFLKPSISDDGRFVSFSSTDSNLTSAIDLNLVLDVFVRDRQTSVTTLASLNNFGLESGNGPSSTALLSRDGSAVYYFSNASNLVGYDSNGGIQDLFVFLNAQQPGQVRFKFAITDAGENAPAATVTISKVGPPGSTATINYSSGDGTATSGVDYKTTAGTLTFGPTETEKTFIVQLVDDTLSENDETIMLRLSNVSGSSVPLGEPAIAVIRIIDNDPLPALQITDVTIAEGDSGNIAAIFVVSLSAPSGRNVTTTVFTQAGTATPNVDFFGGFLTFTFLPRQTTRQIGVLIRGDTAVEDVFENFFLNLTNPVGATIADGQGIVTIVDDDALVLLTEANSQRAIALDSVTSTRDTFRIANNFNFSSDHRTRISLFAAGVRFLPGDKPSALTATAEDSAGTVRPLDVEFVGNVPSFNGLTQIVLKLNDQITFAGDLKIKITLHSVTSNTVLVGVQP